MSQFGMNSALWNIYTSAENTALFLSDPDTYLGRFELEPAEREAIRSSEWGVLLDLGAHPFLMYKMFLRTSGGFSMEAVQRYLGKVHGHPLRDVVT
ncbi:hypothetical protein ACTU6U_10665 [Microbacterium sp. A196]|uniref:hypothetical protein n=1 Tax=Microbacterium sp. A196 TaxID=3457320 RepID=UPI003FD385DC